MKTGREIQGVRQVREVQRTEKVVALLLLSIILAAVVRQTVAKADDHKPVKVPQTVLPWATQSATSTLEMKPSFNYGLFSPRDGNVVVMIENGVEKVVFKGDPNERQIHVTYVDPDWCAREFGHVWRVESSVEQSAAFDASRCDGTVVMRCVICKLTRASTRVCEQEQRTDGAASLSVGLANRMAVAPGSVGTVSTQKSIVRTLEVRPQKP